MRARQENPVRPSLVLFPTESHGGESAEALMETKTIATRFAERLRCVNYCCKPGRRLWM